MIDVGALRALLDEGGSRHLIATAELRELLDAYEFAQEKLTDEPEPQE